MRLEFLSQRPLLTVPDQVCHNQPPGSWGWLGWGANNMRILTTIVFSVCLLFLSGCGTTHGSALMIGEARTPTDPDIIRLLLSPPDAEYIEIAIIEASCSDGMTRKEDQALALRRFKKEAAIVGANAVVLAQQGEVEAGTVMVPIGNMWVASASSGYHLKGLAIYIIPAPQGED